MTRSINRHISLIVSCEIGIVLYGKGKYKEALENLRKALELGISFQKANHPDMAISHTNIGLVLDTQEKYEEALENFKQALNTRRYIHGKIHSDLATAYINIAVVLYTTHSAEAIKYAQKASKISKIVENSRESTAIRTRLWETLVKFSNV